jgi:oxygen-independent coproporphyrinogen-3 oxidase
VKLIANPLDAATPYVAYAYSYPHKSAYRAFPERLPLESVWASEEQTSLFLYVHIPFCEYRCGFCNLFTLANVEEGLTTAYLRQLRREAEVVREALPKADFTRLAIGGGTPTFLNERELEELLDILRCMLGVDVAAIPVSCEASPATLTMEKAHLLKQAGVDRLSLGVQSFDDRESRALGRPQRAEEVCTAIKLAQDAQFPSLNLDLIYGAAGQTVDSWRHSMDKAISFQPEEIYLYPLYVRELTGLGKTCAPATDLRLDLYRAGRQMLLDAGYEQISLRMFCRSRNDSPRSPAYCCQSDGMVGIGCGSRSYTRQVHYSTEFAVGRIGVRSILTEYLQRPREFFRAASYGYRLDLEDQRRRHVILSLLQAEGVDFADYATRFDGDLYDDLPQLEVLLERGWAAEIDGRLRLTSVGLEQSDAIGPWLYSHRAVKLMEESECR